MSQKLTIHSDNGTPNVSAINSNQADPFANLPSPNQGYPFPTSPLIKLSARKVSYQIATLGQTTHVYTSPSYNDMIDLADYFADWSCNYEIQEGPVHTFTVTAPWDTMTSQDFYVSLYATEQWELVPTQDTKDLLVNGLLEDPFTTKYYTIPPVQVQLAIQRALENKTGINLGATTGSFSSSYAPWQGVAQQLLNYKRRGVEAVPSFGQTLKRSAVIDNRNSNGAFQSIADNTRNQINAQGTTNYIMSTQDMMKEYAIPRDTVAAFMLPSYRKQLNVAGVDPFVATVYAGWLVKPPTFQFITRNKVQLTQEFVWNEWLGGMYYIASPSADFNAITVPTGSPY
jgi:hypothetical protein